MPNTYYAKSPETLSIRHLLYGIRYYVDFALTYSAAIAPIIWLLLKSKNSSKHEATNNQEKKYLYFWLVFFSIYSFLIARSGGDNYSAFPMHRHGLTILPTLLVFLFYFTHKLNASKAQMAALIVAIAVAPILRWHNHLLDRHALSRDCEFLLCNDFLNNPYFKWLKSVSNENTIIATSLAGALPLTVDAIHIDILGLNDAYIAHNGKFDPNGPIDSKTDMGYVLSMKPDFIEGYQSASRIISGNCDYKSHGRSRMLTETYENKEFFENYLIVSNAPYAYFDRILFVRKSFLNQAAAKSALIETKPIDCLTTHTWTSPQGYGPDRFGSSG